MLVQPQCFMAPCPAIEVPAASDPGNIRYDRIYTAGQYPSTPPIDLSSAMGQYPTANITSNAGGAYPSSGAPIDWTFGSYSGPSPDFKTSTSSLDWWRVGLLILGIWIGVKLLR